MSPSRKAKIEADLSCRKCGRPVSFAAATKENGKKGRAVIVCGLCRSKK